MIITEEFLEAGKNNEGGWTGGQMRILGADDFTTLPDFYWKNRALYAEIGGSAARAFSAGKTGGGVYYERYTNDRRYSRFPNLMYQGITGFVPPPAPYTARWKGGLLHGGSGNAAVISADGTWEEYWEEGELKLIRAAAPITIIAAEGGLLLYRNTAPFDTGIIDPAYRSKSRRLSWNYTHEKITDAYFVPVDGLKQYRDSKLILRFKNGFLDGDALTKSGRLLVKPAYEEEGRLEYWRNGLLHRDNNLPAVIGGGIKEWWFNGVFIRAEGN